MLKHTHKLHNGFLFGVILFLAVAVTSCGYNYANRSQHSPTVSPDGKMLIFQSDHENPGKYDCVVKFKTNLGWTPPVPLLFANTKMNTAGPFITYDQNNLLLTSDQKGGKGDVDLWIAKRGKALWGRAVNMGAPVNTAGYEGFGSISPDSTTLYFTRECDEKKGNDRFCIFRSIKVNGQWTEPVRMPAPVNSEYSDFAPIIMADGTTIIFASNRPGGRGGYDLYKTEMMSGGAWSEPVNLGDEINTKYDDRIVSVPASGDVIYYSHPEERSGRLVYRIRTAKLPAEMKSSSIITIAGTVTDKNDASKAIGAEIRVTDVQTGGTQVFSSNGEDGKYFIVLNKRKVYELSISRKGYLMYSARLDLADVKKYDAIIRDIELVPIEAGASMILNNLYFRLNSDSVFDYDKTRAELSRLARLMQVNPGMKIEIGGHTDSTGEESYNASLSEKRAQAVYGYLVSQGISRDRLVAKGYGCSKPLAGAPEKNRRVEVTILSVN
ncbi:MAG TPA: OmpA family protein [Spirochaetota bacterium]|nr:PD40 domain-containing protein [Spirochaetota bacterium]HOD15171.1 OmpA family protein [Spirochaetota bacterium]HPN12805.1 OmpA family protein [Spirochaetota bacterium]